MEEIVNTAAPKGDFVINSAVQYVRLKIEHSLEALFEFRRPLARETRHYFENVRPRFRTSGKDLRFMPVDKRFAQELIDKSLLRVRQVPSLEDFEESLDDIKAMLAQPVAQAVSNAIVSALFDLTEMEEVPGSESNTSKKSFGSMFAARPLYYARREFDAEGLERISYFKVLMEPPTTTQQRELENAKPLVTKGGSKDIEHQEDVSTCQRLFAARVRSIEGASYHPMNNTDAPVQPCTEETRKDWAPLVPYYIVSSVLTAEQVRATVGND